MSKNDINYKKFIEYVHQDFETEVSIKEVKEILFLEEDYNKDSPNSLGKSLVLKRLVFSGEKISGEKFHHDQNLYTGINLWIADNHKGKSTIFKIIKLALTGKSSIKPDIKPWINKVLLEFNIGEVTYTSYINSTGRDRGGLYRFGIDKFNELDENQKLETIEQEKEFEFRTNGQLQERIQEFFFEQFSFYTLKYTSHRGAKDDLGLSTNNISWLTYFKSIYLESKNYEYLFFDKEDMGAQGRKIFEMILGLPLTYPINMLGVQRDRVMEKIGKLKFIDSSKKETTKETTKETKDKIENDLKKVRKKLEEIKKGGEISFSEKPLVDEYTEIQERVNEIRKKQRIESETYELEKTKLPILKEEIYNLREDKRKINVEINKLTKEELNISLLSYTLSICFIFL